MDLPEKLKAHLILTHHEDDPLLRSYLAASISFAEGYQKKDPAYYAVNPMSPVTEQAILMLAAHMYESRDGSTGGFFADSVPAAQQVMETVKYMLVLDKDWKV